MMTVAVFALLVGLMLAGIPIAVAMGLTAIAIMIAMGGFDLLVIFAQRFYSPVTSFPLLAVPFFILAGNLMNAGGLTHRIFSVALLIVGRMPGGLGHVNVVGSMIFSGMSGSAVADAAGLGVIEINHMKKAGYSPPFAATITAVSSVIGPIIPPSVPLVIYGSLAQVSIGALFLAGVLPGVLMGIALMIVIFFVARARNLPVSPGRPPFLETSRIVVTALPALVMPLVIVGSMMIGWATPTEAAVVASIYAFLLGAIVYRDLDWRQVPGVFLESAKQTAQVFFIIATAGAFGWVLVQQQIPNAIIASVLEFSNTPWVILLLINIVLLILGMFIEGLAIIILVYPILVPLALKIGIDPVHFGMVVVLNIMIGLVTPPVGLCLFIVSQISGATIPQILKELWPYLIALLAVLALVTYVPAISLFLPRLFGF